MLKKIIITAVSVTLGSVLLFGTSAVSYLKTAKRNVSESFEQTVPIEFQIERASGMVDDLSPVIKQSMHVVAKEEIELEQLSQQIKRAQANAEKSESDIMRLQSDLQQDRDVFTYASRSYSRDQVKADLVRRFTHHKVSDETLAHLTKMRDARSRNLDAARQKLASLIQAQKQLETDIVNLQAKRKLNEVAQASSELVIDDSKLARTKDLINSIRTKLDVQARLAQSDSNFAGEINLDTPAAEDISDQVTAYFGKKQGSQVADQAPDFLTASIELE